MLNTPHVLTGAVIGVATGNPVIGFLGGLASHFLLDSVPHTDPGTWHHDEPFPHPVNERDMTIGFVDLAIAIGLVLWLAGEAPLVAAAPLAAMFGAILPDILVVISLFWPKFSTYPGLNKYFALTEKYHKTMPLKYWHWGILTQATVVVVAVWYLLGS